MVHTDPPLQIEEPKQEMQHAEQAGGQPRTRRPYAGSRPYGTNTTRAVWAFLKENPRTDRIEAIHELTRLGYNKASVTSLIGQMVLQRLVHQYADNTLATTTPEFRPLLSGKARDAFVKARIEELRRRNPQRATMLERLSATRRQRAQQRKEDAMSTNSEKTTDHRPSALEKGRRKLAQLRKKAADEGRVYRKGDPVAVPAPRGRPPVKKTATAKKAMTPARSRSVNIDKVHNGAWPDVRQIVQEHSAPNLRGMSPEEIVDAMSLTQAREVFQKLGDFFATR